MIKGEIAIFDLESHGAARDFGAFDPVPGVTRDPLELGGEPAGVAQILIEGALGADRFVGPVGLDLALVDTAANSPIPVVELQSTEIAGIRLDLYVLRFEKEKMTLRVPVNKAETRWACASCRPTRR